MPKSRHQMQYLTAVTASLAYTNYYTFMGWPGTTLPSLQAEDSPIPITADEGSWLASINSLTMLVAIIIAGYAVDIVGRKKLLLASAVPTFIWWLMVAFADSYEMLLAARCVGSLTGGLVNTVAPMYLGEIADAEIRGAVVAVHIILAQGGNLLIYCIAPYLSIQITSAICACIPILFFVIFVWMPESPYFLLIRNQEKEVVKSLERLKGKLSPDELKLELNAMHETVRRKQEANGKLKDLFLIPMHRRTLFIVVGYIVLQMSTGAIALTAYTTSIFDKSGSSLDPDLSSIILVAVEMAANIVSMLTADRLGRRPLSIASFLACGVCLTVEGAYFYAEYVLGSVPSAFDWVPLAALIGFRLSFGLGVGALFVVIIGEMFHVSVKGAASSINSAIIALYGFFLKKMFQVVSDNMGSYYSFWGFAVLCVCGAVYTYVVMPETKGKTFAQINEEMDARTGGGSALRSVDLK